MNIPQFITSSDLVGIAPEIILTLTAICVLSLEMIKISKASISMSIAALGIVGAGTGVAQPVNDAMSMQQEALASVENPTIDPTTIQQTQVNQGTGLNTLTQGPAPVNTTDIIQEDASDIYSGAAFGNQAFTKKGSIIPNLIKTKK